MMPTLELALLGLLCIVSFGGCASGGMGSNGAAAGPAPSITSISPRFVEAGATSFQLTVNGSGFNATSSVLSNGTALPTTFSNATQVIATVPASAVASYGWADVTVSNSGTGGGTSSATALTIYGVIANPANAIHYDPAGNLLYATIPPSAGGITGNSLVAINPSTGAIGSPVAIGVAPTLMAESSDGKYLYIYASGNLMQYDLGLQRVNQTVPLSNVTSSPLLSMAVMPGTDNTLVVNWLGIDAIVDINGSTATPRPHLGAGFFPTFLDATHVDAYDPSAEWLDRYSIDAGGFTPIDEPTLCCMSNASYEIFSGTLYSANGLVVNLQATPLSVIATLPTPDFANLASQSYPITAVAEAADPSLGKEFMVLQDQQFTGLSTYGLVRYSLTSYSAEDSFVLPDALQGTQSRYALQRFGPDGVAVLNFSGSSATPAGEIFLFRGPFVAPQE